MTATITPLSPSPFFSKEEIDQVKEGVIPEHIAIIPDGNRRWAQNRNKESEEGHHEGANGIIDIVEAASDLGVQFVTIWAFGTENWKRSDEEVTALMTLIELFLVGQRERMMEKRVRLKHIGEISKLPDRVKKALKETSSLTANNKKVTVYMALNYGGRDEITRGVKSLISDVIEGKVTKEQVDESTISSYLDTYEIPDPNLVIRTSGEYRISNYMLWQCSYSEFYFTETLWPDFTPKHLKEAILEFQRRERREGK